MTPKTKPPGKSYAEMLEDPRWQKKRLEIFQRDRWSCQRCGDTTKTLQVHHIKYEYGKAPWEYPGNNFLTLCATCHEGEHFEMPVKIEQVVTQVQYEGLYKEDPPVFRLIDEQIGELQMKLREPLSDELQAEILKNIMFLQGKRKELLNG